MKRSMLLWAVLALSIGACVSTQQPRTITTVRGAYEAPVCTRGESVKYDPAKTFHIDVLVVGDGARAYDAISTYGNDAGQVLYKTVGRYFGPMTVTFYLNIGVSLLPSHLPVLIGKGYCLDMMPVQSDGPGWSKVVARIHGKSEGGPVANGQVALVVPRMLLTRLQDTQGNHLTFLPAVSLDIPTKYNAPIIEGRFAGRPSTAIARPSGIPGISWAEKRVLDGQAASLFYFVYGRN